MAAEKYSVELEKLLNDLKESPGTLLQSTAQLRSRIQALRAPERLIWFEKLDKIGAEQAEKLHELIHKDD